MVRRRVAKDVVTLRIEARALNRRTNDGLTRLVDQTKASRWLIGRWRRGDETTVVHGDPIASAISTDLAAPQHHPYEREKDDNPTDGLEGDDHAHPLAAPIASLAQVTLLSVVNARSVGEQSVLSAVVHERLARLRRGEVQLGDDHVVVAMRRHLANRAFEISETAVEKG